MNVQINNNFYGNKNKGGGGNEFAKKFMKCIKEREYVIKKEDRADLLVEVEETAASLDIIFFRAIGKDVPGTFAWATATTTHSPTTIPSRDSAPSRDTNTETKVSDSTHTHTHTHTHIHPQTASRLRNGAARADRSTQPRLRGSTPPVESSNP